MNNNKLDRDSIASPVKPADLFRMRQTASPFFHLDTQSPLKCLNNVTDPSPTKNLPTLLRNPFQKPVKRKLKLGSSPIKGITPSPTSKRTRMLGFGEDANLEPPKMKQHREATNKLISNDKSDENSAQGSATPVYQHPYLSWIKLFPRNAPRPIGFSVGRKVDSVFKLTSDSPLTKMMYKDWCTSLDHLLELFLDGKCPEFQIYADRFTVTFVHIPASPPREANVKASIKPISYNMSNRLEKLGIELRYPDMKSSSSSDLISLSKDQSSQHSFGSLIDLAESTQNSQSQQEIKPPASKDSGNGSDSEEEEVSGDEDDENGDCSRRFLTELSLTPQEISLKERPKGFVEADSNTQSKIMSSKPVGLIEDTDGIKKLIDFLKSERCYTIDTLGRYANIPPTLIAPCEFKLSTYVG